MKFFAPLAVALFLAIPAARAQQSPDDQYVIIYTLIQQGDANVAAGQTKEALGDYAEAQRELQKFQQVYSDWNPKIVNYRLGYLTDKIAALTPPAPETNAQPVNVPPPTPADWQAQLDALNGQISQLQSDNSTLNAKLKEALSAQPATVTPEAFAQIQAQVNELSKENDLLKAAAAQPTNAAVNIPNNPQMQQDLAQQTARADQLARENQSLQAQLQTMTTDANAMEALREENALLKKELAGINSAPAVNGSSDLAGARAQLEQMRGESTANWLEKAGLENRIRQWQEVLVNTAPDGSASGSADLQSQVTALSQQVATLQARLAADESPAVPYTPQELALFTPEPIAANRNSENKSIQQMPGTAAVLVAEAENYSTNREYDRAAADYHEILNRDPNNSFVLANLAAIELEQNKVADADTHIQAALAQDPNDAFNLTVLGQVRFTQGNFDGALDALSRAAKLDPQNAQIENFLGVTLAENGLRAQAETAFRKAVDLVPDYGDAHKNLAIIYLGENPPKVEMARWHYEKALAAGVPASPELEKMLNAGSTASPQ